MGRLIDVELRDEFLQRSCIFVVHDAVDLEVILLIDFFDVAYTVEVDDRFHEGLRRDVRMLQFEEDALTAKFIGFTVTGPDAEERFKKQQRPGGRTDEEVIRQVLQGKADAVMLLITGFRRIAEHRVL